jgi:hypothetical protein
MTKLLPRLATPRRRQRRSGGVFEIRVVVTQRKSQGDLPRLTAAALRLGWTLPILKEGGRGVPTRHQIEPEDWACPAPRRRNWEPAGNLWVRRLGRLGQQNQNRASAGFK